MISSFINHHKSIHENINTFYSDFLAEITESEPLEFENYEEYEKWKTDNEYRSCHILDINGDGDMLYSRYDELVIYYDTTCNCFNKDKIKTRILVDYNTA